MADTLPPMPPCPYHKRGQHDSSYFVDETSGTVTQVCDACMTARRFTTDGNLSEIPLDALSRDEIAALFPHGETR